MAARPRKVRTVSNPNDPLWRIERVPEPQPDESSEDDPVVRVPDERWVSHSGPREVSPSWEEPRPSWDERPQPVGVAGEAGDGEAEFHHPLDRVTGGLPRRLRVVVDWIVTIVGAIAIVLAIKAWVVNPYRIPSSSMEPTLHCARPASGCEARFSDRVLANRFIFHFRDPKRGEIVVFNTTAEVRQKCNAGGTFVKRIVGLPGDSVQSRLINGKDYVFVNGKQLEEPYIQPDRRSADPTKTYKVPQGSYFMMGDNRASSCDSRSWGALPRNNIIGKVFMTYWPPNRISFR
jgi:signal peptidase I